MFYLATISVISTVSVADIKQYEYGVSVEYFQQQPRVQAKQKQRDELTYFLFTRPMKMEQTVRPETSAHKIHTPWNHPKEIIQLTHS